MFEYVTRRECSQTRIKVENIISSVHKELKQFGIKFQHRVVGSASRNLITILKNSNDGYDFDFDLELTQLPTELWNDPKKIKQIVINAFNKCRLEFDNAEDSTSVFTLKYKDTHNKRVLYSVDFAISRYVKNGDKLEKEYIYYNKRSKSNNDYIWQKKSGKIDYANYETKIKKAKLWNIVKEKYLKNKDKEPNKKSRIIFYETLKWVYDNKIHKIK